MVTAIILLQVQRDKINILAEAMASMPKVSEVYSVTGNYDLVAMVRVKDNPALADFVTHDLAQLQGIEKTDTMLAFKTFSEHDLEAMFSL